MVLDNVNLTASTVSAVEGIVENVPFATVSPNPATDQVQVSIQNFGGKSAVRWELFAATGSRVMFGESRDWHFSIDLSKQEAGAFYLKIEGQSGVQAVKIFKI